MTTVLLSVLLYTYFFHTILSFCIIHLWFFHYFWAAPTVFHDENQSWSCGNLLYIVSLCTVSLWWAFAIRRPTWSAANNIDDVHDIGWCVLYGGTSHPSTKCLMIIYILWGYTGYHTGTSKKYSKHSSSACAKKNRTLNTACSHY